MEIDLGNGRTGLVDPEDWESLKIYKWRAASNSQKANCNWYVRAFGIDRDGRKRDILMHRMIMDAPREMFVDHINGNGLDNRRANLRLCGNAENQANRVARHHPLHPTGFKGIQKRYGGKSWAAQLRQTYLGSFDSAAIAALAYDKAAIRHYGDFARTNFPPDLVKYIIQLEEK